MIKVIEKNGSLYTPYNAIVDEWQRKIHAEYEDKDHMLITRSEWGEPMTPEWKDNKLVDSEGYLGSYVLAMCLFDARETGALEDIQEVELPDGSIFNIESELYKGEKHRKEFNPYETN